MNRTIPIVVAVIAMGVCTYVQGRWSERWGTPNAAELQEWAERLDHLPTSFGNWEGQVVEANEQQVKAAGARGAAGMAYRNRETGEVVSVFLVCGSARRVSTHTPDKCYVAAGFRMDYEPQMHTIMVNDQEAQFFTAPFNKSDTISTTRLRILWTWSPDGNWIAPNKPATAKMALSKYNSLYKMYVICETTSMDQKPEDTPCEGFVKEYLPKLNQILFAGQNASDATNQTTAQRETAAAPRS